MGPRRVRLHALRVYVIRRVFFVYLSKENVMAENKSDDLHAMRHSLAHIMATAIQHLWPNAKFGVGPVVDSGFYYDVDLGDAKLSDEDFTKIEAEMKKV